MTQPQVCQPWYCKSVPWFFSLSFLPVIPGSTQHSFFLPVISALCSPCQSDRVSDKCAAFSTVAFTVAGLLHSPSCTFHSVLYERQIWLLRMITSTHNALHCSSYNYSYNYSSLLCLPTPDTHAQQPYHLHPFVAEQTYVKGLRNRSSQNCSGNKGQSSWTRLSCLILITTG